MAFNVRGFLRQLPADRIKDYFASRSLTVPSAWGSEKASTWLPERLSIF